MALFESSNPTLSEKVFQKNHSSYQDIDNVMTVRGTMNKFGFLMLMVAAAATYTWQLYSQSNPSLMSTLMWVGVIGGLVVGLVISFKPQWSPYLAPAYGILEGFFVGAISVVLNEAFKESFPGLIISAVGLTIAVAMAMFLLYNFRVIRPTQRFRSILMSATLGIGLFYLASIVLRLSLEFLCPL